MFFVEGYIFFPFFEGAHDMFIMSIFFQQAIEAETAGMVLGILGFAVGEVAFCKAEVIDGIQEVGLSGAVAPGDAYDTFVEPEIAPGVILKLD